MDIRKFFHELSRRNVLRAVIAYIAVAWVIIEFASVILPIFEAPPYLLKGLIYLLALGLVFWTGFSWIYDFTPEGVRKIAEVHEDLELRELSNRRLNSIIAGAGITALLLLLAGSFWAGAEWNRAGGVDSTRRIAVIPLKHLKGQADTEYLESGVTEALIDELSRVGQFTVLSIHSSRQFNAGIAPENPLLREGSESVDYFVSGSFEKQGTRLKVLLELREALESNPLWEREYQADLSGARNLWRDIALEVSRTILPGNTVLPRHFKQELRPVLPETYELYLKGKYYLNKSTVDDWQRGLVYLQEAIDRNPADPYAHAGMAEGYITWGHSLMPPEDIFPKALDAAKRAIEIDSSNAEGWAALSQYHTYYGHDWELADQAFKKADSLNPNLAMNHYHRAWYMALFGRMNEAIEAHKRAQEIDPFSSLHTVWLAELYRWVGRYDLALKQAEEASRMFDDNALSLVLKGRIYIDQGKVEEGLLLMKEAVRINSGWKYLMYGPALFSNGRREEGLEILKEAESLPESPYFSLCLASMYHADGNMDKAFEWLEKASGHAFYAWTVRHYLATDERMVQDPRYQELLSELKLPPPGPLQYDPDL